MRIIFPDGTSYIYEESPATNIPIPIKPPLPSWLVTTSNGYMPAIQLLDPTLESRQSPLPETGMIFPDRPYNITTDRVAATSKIISNLNNNYDWWLWIVDCIGPTNAKRFRTPGDGYMDTNEPNSDDLKLMSATSGGNLLNIKGEHIQGTDKWYIIEKLDFSVKPIKKSDGWYYNNRKLTYRSHPYLFNVRTNRKRVNGELVWLTAGKINVANDVGPEGGKGHEAWPAVANKIAAQRSQDLFVLPKLPFITTIYKNSLIVDGVRVNQSGGLNARIVRYRFHGPDIYGYDSISTKWYKLSEMLIRGTLENRDGGNGYDWRCYINELIPSRRTCPAPDCNWIRP